MAPPKKILYGSYSIHKIALVHLQISVSHFHFLLDTSQIFKLLGFFWFWNVCNLLCSCWAVPLANNHELHLLKMMSRLYFSISFNIFWNFLSVFAIKTVSCAHPMLLRVWLPLMNCCRTSTSLGNVSFYSLNNSSVKTHPSLKYRLYIWLFTERVFFIKCFAAGIDSGLF